MNEHEGDQVEDAREEEGSGDDDDGDDDNGWGYNCSWKIGATGTDSM